MFREEYPRPGFVRPDWRNLNGSWQFEIEKSGKSYLDGAAYDSVIEVPFCPESKLSGIAHTEPLTSVWYRRAFSLAGAAFPALLWYRRHHTCIILFSLFSIHFITAGW